MTTQHQAHQVDATADDLDNQHGWEGIVPAVACILAIDLLVALCGAWLAGLRWPDLIHALPG